MPSASAAVAVRLMVAGANSVQRELKIPFNFSLVWCSIRNGRLLGHVTSILTVRTTVLSINEMNTDSFPDLILDKYLLQDLCSVTVHYTG